MDIVLLTILRYFAVQQTIFSLIWKSTRLNLTLHFNVISLMLHYTTVSTFDILVSEHTTERQAAHENSSLIRSQLCVCVCVCHATFNKQRFSRENEKWCKHHWRTPPTPYSLVPNIQTFLGGGGGGRANLTMRDNASTAVFLTTEVGWGVTVGRWFSVSRLSKEHIFDCIQHLRDHGQRATRKETELFAERLSEVLCPQNNDQDQEVAQDQLHNTQLHPFNRKNVLKHLL